MKQLEDIKINIKIKIKRSALWVSLMFMFIYADFISLMIPGRVMGFNDGITIVQVFWGLWLFPFGYLVFKSRLIPRVFGILLMLGCVSYLIRFTGAILLPELDIPSFIRLPTSIAEIGTCLWLLIMGAKDPLIDKLSPPLPNHAALYKEASSPVSSR